MKATVEMIVLQIVAPGSPLRCDMRLHSPAVGIITLKNQTLSQLAQSSSNAPVGWPNRRLKPEGPRPEVI